MWRTVLSTPLSASSELMSYRFCSVASPMLASRLLVNQLNRSGANCYILANRNATTESINPMPSLKEAFKQTTPKPPPPPPPKAFSYRKFLVLFAGGALSYYLVSMAIDRNNDRKKNGITVDLEAINRSSSNLPGNINPSKHFERERNPSDIKITLYQYQSCPFCCKVRAYLDYYGYTYDIVEVNSINKRQLDWTEYKKVPLVAVQVPTSSDPSAPFDIVQLTESSVIVSLLESYRLDPKIPLRQLRSYFEPLIVHADDNKTKSQNDYMNRYFVMLHNEAMSDGKTNFERKEERDWREWVDTKFIHAISPNVYRTLGEALETFKWFDKVGNWAENFTSFERQSAIYIGTIIMYLISWNLKRKYQLKENVRESLYDYCEEWVSTLDSKQPFRGGESPNLADLALYGAIGSFEGCRAFDDMMANTRIKSWYEACKKQVKENAGRSQLVTPFVKSNSGEAIKSSINSADNNKKKKKFFGLF